MKKNQQKKAKSQQNKNKGILIFLFSFFLFYNKMIKTIIHDFENLDIDKVKSAQLILKFNSELKKLGFNKVYVKNYRLGKDDIEEKLTLVFNPIHESNSRYSERNYRRDSFKDLADYLVSLGGCGSLGYYYALSKNVFEEQIQLKIKHDNKSYNIGNYLPTRNIVIIEFYPFLENWNLGKGNKYMLQLLEWIKEVVTNYKIKEGNVEELKEKIFIAKFTSAINFEISNILNTMENCESSIESYKPQIAEWYNKILTSKMIIGNLNKMLENIKGNLLQKIEEIKRLKFVKKVELTQEGIVLEFEKIFIKVKEKDIEMGEFVITLMPTNIKIKNKEPVKYGSNIYHSCHISDSQVCFGKEKTTAYELLGKMELKKLTHFLYLYLKSYNPEDTYLSMNYWIKGKENGGVVPVNYDCDEEENEDEDNETGDM